MIVKRGDIYLVDFGKAQGSEQGGIRPAVIVQNDIGNKYSPTTIVCPLTSKAKKEMPTHVHLSSYDGTVEKPSVALCEQIQTTDKTRLIKKLGEIFSERKKEELTSKIIAAVQ